MDTVANSSKAYYRRQPAVVRDFASRNTDTNTVFFKGKSVSSDASLLQRIATGDQAAVAACIDEFGGLVWSLARRLTPNEADAEDAVQEIFVEIWRFADRFDPAKASEATFIAMLARRRLIDRLRKHNRRPVEETFDEALTSAPSAEQAAEVGVDVARVASAMQTMKPEQREAVQLSAWMGMSHAAIAEKMDLPLGTVKSHIRRGLLMLREDLGAEYATSTSGTRS
ncbi:MAG: sigma-70 family RNA polymerase sigma factor [Pseudomonadota bacterium]